jgi:SAM-dependent methyltransferase
MTAALATSADAAASYVLGADDAERARLLQQARTHAAAAERLLGEIGVARGWRAIDVGCGPIGILPQLAARVGPQGSVLGLDAEPRMIDMARRTLDEQSLGHVLLHEAPAEATGLPRESFDLAHARLLLVNVARPQQVVVEMAALLRPGGVLAVQDVDWLSWTCEPPHPAWNRLRDALAAMRCGAGLDVHIGRRLPALLTLAGMQDVRVRADVQVLRRGDADHTLLLTFARLHRERLVAGGHLGAVEIDALCAALGEHLARDGTLSICALFFQAWGRKAPCSNDNVSTSMERQQG